MIYLYTYKEQPYTDKIKTRPIEGQIYSFEYGPIGKKQTYQTGDKVSQHQDSIIMAIPTEETLSFNKEKRQYVWFQCRICGKLAYGTMHQAKSKKSPYYNPCGCYKKQNSSEIGKRTGPMNCQHFIEWAKSPEGRASSSHIGKTIGCKNIVYAQKYCKEHPEHYQKLGQKNIKYALIGLKQWQKDNPEKVQYYQQKATEAATQWKKENPEKFKQICAENYANLRASAKPSKGEEIVINYLKQNNINYQREYSIENLLGPHGRPRRLDFMVFYQNKQFAIEVNGGQHYIKNHLFEQTSQDTLTIQEIDDLKKQWCQKNNIPLYIIDARVLSTVLPQLQNIIKEMYMSEELDVELTPEMEEELNSMGKGE